MTYDYRAANERVTKYLQNKAIMQDYHKLMDEIYTKKEIQDIIKESRCELAVKSLYRFCVNEWK